MSKEREDKVHAEMKEKYSNIDKLAIILIVLFSFYYLDPFFTWKTFMGGRLRTLFGVIPFRTIFGLGIIFLWICVYAKKGAEKGIIKLSILVISVALFTIVLAGGIDNNQTFSLSWLPYFVVAVFLLYPEKIQVESYRVFVFIFAVSLVLPIIWYVLTHIGIKIPYVVLESYEEIKVIRGKYYKLYPLATQITSKWDPAFQELHLCGIYDEAGRVGTVAGLILVSEKFKLRGNWKNVVILLGGILAFSLAFYAITVIYFIISCFEKRNYKKFGIVLCGVLAYFLFMNVQFNDPNITKFQERFEFTSEGLSGNNRTNDEFDGLMDEFYRSSIYDVLFGKGPEAITKIQNKRNIDGSSYKSLIFNYGIVGFGMSILWIALYCLSKARKKGADKMHIFAIFAVYVANIYQRPTMFMMGYLLIMFGGILSAAERNIGTSNGTLRRRRGFFV